MSINKVFLLGNLGRDPEIRHGKEGAAICNLSVATEESWKDRDGTRQKKTEWHRVVCFGKAAEFIGSVARKGSQVFIEGRIQSRDWQKKDGTKTTIVEIVAANAQILDKRQQGEKPQTQEASAEPTYTDDDIPF